MKSDILITANQKQLGLRQQTLKVNSLSERTEMPHAESDDESSTQEVELDTNNQPLPIPVQAHLPDKLPKKRIVLNISHTQYPIIEEVAEELGWLVQKQEGVGDWDLWWTDHEILPQTLYRMHLFQKVNYCPGIEHIAYKNLLALGLTEMKDQFPKHFDFFPETWIVPSQFPQLRKEFEKNAATHTYIVKPEALSQGRGIFLTRDIADIMTGYKYVVQRYIPNPLLMDGLKFDLRMYVLLASSSPLRLFLFQQGLTRLATENYEAPTQQNLSRAYIHLTNYALNKTSPSYMQGEAGHKRSLSSTFEWLRKRGVDMTALHTRISQAIVKTVISGLPHIAQQYRSCQPEDYEGTMCFHILGFDVMLTDKLEPIVLQVNHTPSFATGSPLDYAIKKQLVKDTLTLMRITSKTKRALFERAKTLAKLRLEKGERDILCGEARISVQKEAQLNRDRAEQGLMGGYVKIYPFNSAQEPQLVELYSQFERTAEVLAKKRDQRRRRTVDQKSRKALNDERRLQKKKRSIIVSETGDVYKKRRDSQPAKTAKDKSELDNPAKTKHLNFRSKVSSHKQNIPFGYQQSPGVTAHFNDVMKKLISSQRLLCEYLGAKDQTPCQTERNEGMQLIHKPKPVEPALRQGCFLKPKIYALSSNQQQRLKANLSHPVGTKKPDETSCYSGHHLKGNQTNPIQALKLAIRTHCSPPLKQPFCKPDK